MSKNFDGIKTQRFGCEVECTGLTRNISRQMKSSTGLSMTIISHRTRKVNLTNTANSTKKVI